MYAIEEVSIYFPSPRKMMIYYKLKNGVSVRVRSKYTPKNLAEKFHFPEYMETTAIDFQKPIEEPIILKPSDIILSN